MPKMQISLSEFVTLVSGKPLEFWQSKLLNEYEASLSSPTVAQALTTVAAAGADEIKTAVEKVEASAKADKATKQNAADDAEKAAAFQTKIDADKAAAKNAASAAGTVPAAADTQSTAGAAGTATDEAQTSYDYAKDVRPLLVALAKAKGTDALKELLATFDAKNGDALKAEQFADVIAAAKKAAA